MFGVRDRWERLVLQRFAVAVLSSLLIEHLEGSSSEKIEMFSSSIHFAAPKVGHVMGLIS